MLNQTMKIISDDKNDVVFTPTCVATLMSRLSRVNSNSIVADVCMGTGNLLSSAADVIGDCNRQKQLIGYEINEILYNESLKNLLLQDIDCNLFCSDFLADDGAGSVISNCNVLLLNPPYSREGKGFIFVEKALSRMTTGYAAILIQENAGAGQGDGYTERLLRNNTLVASIKMPTDLFIGKSSVQTAIYVFKVGRPHETDDLVKFIDMSNDGYSRQNRKKSTQEVNLKDTDHAVERYDEVVDHVLGNKPQTNFYTRENGLYVEDTITMRGDDWTYDQHKKIDTILTESDFRKTVADYLAWRVAAIMRGEVQTNE